MRKMLLRLWNEFKRGAVVPLHCIALHEQCNEMQSALLQYMNRFTVHCTAMHYIVTYIDIQCIAQLYILYCYNYWQVENILKVIIWMEMVAPSSLATSIDWLFSAPPLLQKHFVLLLGTFAQSKRHRP